MNGKHSKNYREYEEKEDEIPKAFRNNNEDEIPRAFRKKNENEIPRKLKNEDILSKNENFGEYEENNSEIPKALQNEQNIEEREVKEKMGKEKKKKHKKLKIFGRIVLVLIIIIAILLGTAYWYITNKMGKMNKVDINEADLGISTETNSKLSGYRNTAIFGVDSRSDDYGVGNRSDCIIIASINNSTGEIKLISVYRDTYVDIKGHGLDKITHAYSYGEAPLAINTLNKNLDLNIKEFVTVNFDSVAQAVDQLGGVKINVTAEETKYINTYIDETARVTGKTANHITQAGTYNMDGVQAVAYSRIRYTAGGDYKRTERMRTVIEAMLTKLKTKNVAEINSFADKILPCVYTNISSGDLISMIPSMAKYKVGESIGWPYETKGKTMDRWYGIPITLQSNVEQLHKEAFGENDYTASNDVKTISDSIIKKTGYTK